MKRYRKPKIREGELRLYYGKIPGEAPDIFVAWQGDPSMRFDSNLLMHEICAEKPDPRVQPLFSKMNPSLLKELELRGYDITTIKFSIMKKAAPNE